MKRFFGALSVHLGTIAAVMTLAGCGDGSNSDHQFEFGLIDAEGRIHPNEGNQIPHIVGQRYGWRVTFPSLRGTVTLREKLTLPSSAEWELGDRYNESKPDGPSMSERLEIGANGQIFEDEIEIKAHEEVSRIARLGVLATDPTGLYRLELFANGELIETCEFTLVAVD